MAKASAPKDEGFRKPDPMRSKAWGAMPPNNAAYLPPMDHEADEQRRDADIRIKVTRDFKADFKAVADRNARSQTAEGRIALEYWVNRHAVAEHIAEGGHRVAAAGGADE